MSNSKPFNEMALNEGNKSLETDASQASFWKSFLATIKIGIVNSNLITTFTGLWLALHFTNNRFLDNLISVRYILLFCSVNTIITFYVWLSIYI